MVIRHLPKNVQRECWGVGVGGGGVGKKGAVETDHKAWALVPLDVPGALPRPGVQIQLEPRLRRLG